jgi:hypothetical protein
MLTAASQLPTLWDPEDLFYHLALWAGAPAVATALVLWLLTLYGNFKSWVSFGKKADGVPVAVRAKVDVVQKNFRGWTTPQQRAVALLFLYSVLTVAFTYILTEIIYVFVEMCLLDPDLTFSASSLRDFAVAVTPWPSPVVWTVGIEIAAIALLGGAYIGEMSGLKKLITFLGGTARAIARTGAVLLGLGTVGGLISPLISRNQGPSAATPLSFTATIAVTAVLCLGLALSLTRVHRATAVAFAPRKRPITHVGPDGRVWPSQS